MLGADISNSANAWPKCGEIDIMENIGKEPSSNHGSLHMLAAGTANDDQLSGMYTLPGGAKLGDGFHTYAVEWSASAIKFYVDDHSTRRRRPPQRPGATGVQPAVLHHLERGRGRELSQGAKLEHDVPANDEGQTGCASISRPMPAELTPAPRRLRPDH